MNRTLAAGFAALLGATGTALPTIAWAQQDPPVEPQPTPNHASQAAGATQQAAAPTPKPVGSFKSWAAYTFEDKGRLMCYAQATPTGTIGNDSGRGKAAAMVIQAPDAGAKDQLSVVLGFPPQAGKPVQVKIGRNRHWRIFNLKKFGVGRAWADTDSQDQQMVGAMKRSDFMVVYVVSDKGQKVQDTYNLSGFERAYNAAVTACK
jgi:hypothetical protein